MVPGRLTDGQSYFPFPSLTEQSGNLTPVSCKLSQGIRCILQQNCFKLAGLPPLAAQEDPSTRQSLLPVSQAAKSKACWLLLNSLFGKWARRLVTRKNLERCPQKTLTPKKSFPVTLSILISH